MSTETLPEHIKRFRLGIYTSDFSQPISLMRVIGPFAAMSRKDRRLELVRPPLELPDPANGKVGGHRLNWDWLAECDALFLFHPEGDVHVHCASLAWQLGIPIWAEYVDDIFNVESHNPGWKVRQNRRALAENVGSVCAWASVVTCVSEYNRTAILRAIADFQPEGLQMDFESKFLVLPEGCFWPPSSLTRRKCVSWRGLGSHGGDVDEALPHLVAAARQFPDWSWMLSGDPEILEEIGRQLSPICGKQNVLLAPFWPTPFEMMQAWTAQAPYLHVVPLADTAFNRSKSHLAWLEATAVGAAVIAPDHLPEWDMPGVIKYRNSPIVRNGDNSLSTVLMREISFYNEGLFHSEVHVAREAVYPARTIASLNLRRWAILRKLTELAQPKPAGIHPAAAGMGVPS